VLADGRQEQVATGGVEADLLWWFSANTFIATLLSVWKKSFDRGVR